MSDQPTAPTDTRTDRERRLDDLAALVEWLRAHPEVPISDYGTGVTYCVPGEDDAAALAALTAIAEAAGTAVTGYRGAPVTESEAHLYATYTVGSAAYQATYIRREHMREYHALMSYRGAVTGEAS